MAWFAGLVGIIGGSYATYHGVRTWQGRELVHVTRILEDPATRRRNYLGGRTLFATIHGSALAGLVGGPGFAILGAGMLVPGLRRPAGQPLWWEVSATIAFVLLAAGAIYSTAYVFVDLPDRLRPPCQRGQPRPGRVGPEGQLHPVDQLDLIGGHVDLGPDPTRPPWVRGVSLVPGTPHPTAPPTGSEREDRRRAIWRALVDPPGRR